MGNLCETPDVYEYDEEDSEDTIDQQKSYSYPTKFGIVYVENGKNDYKDNQ